MAKKRKILGLTETVILQGNNRKKKVAARIDTGAKTSSIDVKLAKELGLGKVIRKKKVKSASGITVRPIKKAKIKLKDKVMFAEFTIADRNHMRYKVLVGRNILTKTGFLIDPAK